MSKRVYFVGLEQVIDEAVNYYRRYGARLPSDLKSAIDATMLVLDTVLLAIQLWDFGHAGGHPSA